MKLKFSKGIEKFSKGNINFEQCLTKKISAKFRDYAPNCSVCHQLFDSKWQAYFPIRGMLNTDAISRLSTIRFLFFH